MTGFHRDWIGEGIDRGDPGVPKFREEQICACSHCQAFDADLGRFEDWSSTALGHSSLGVNETELKNCAVHRTDDPYEQKTAAARVSVVSLLPCVHTPVFQMDQPERLVYEQILTSRQYKRGGHKGLF